MRTSKNEGRILYEARRREESREGQWNEKKRHLGYIRNGITEKVLGEERKKDFCWD